MILAETLKTLTTFTAEGLTRAIRLTGYKRDKFNTAKFLGMTNGGQFCYSVTYTDDVEGNECTTKVYVSYNPTEGKVSVDY
jgi:hypothetical protein